jgi:DNA repair protein RadD
MFQFRDYQQAAVEDARRCFANGDRRILLVAPTGAGKTVIAAMFAKLAVEKNRRVLFLAHRRELVKQCESKLINFGVEPGIIMAGEDIQLDYEVQVASIDTLRARAMSTDRMPMPHADVVMIDEAHRSLAPTYLQLIEAYPNAAIIGLTATPVRGDGKGLGHVYDDMVLCPSVGELTEAGHLVPARYFAPTIPDLTGVKVVRGDYDQKQLEDAMNRREPVGDVIENWGRICPDRPTIVFASGVKHSIHLCEEFQKAGVRAVHVDGNMTTLERDAAINGLLTGKYQVVTNCMVLTEGFDMPELSCCVLVRPTKNIGLYLQMAGRVLRPSHGKSDTIIIDHSGNVYEHGFVADDHGWQLDENMPMRPKPERDRARKEAKQITCVKCAHIYSGSPVCPSCGHVPRVRGEAIETRHAVLTEVEGRKTAKKKQYSMEEKQAWYQMLKHYAQTKGKKDAWIAHTYKAKFDVWPNPVDKDAPPIEPTLEVSGFIRHRNIAYAKRKTAEVDARKKGARSAHRAMEVKA